MSWDFDVLKNLKANLENSYVGQMESSRKMGLHLKQAKFLTLSKLYWEDTKSSQ